MFGGLGVGCGGGGERLSLGNSFSFVEDVMNDLQKTDTAYSPAHVMHYCNLSTSSSMPAAKGPALWHNSFSDQSIVLTR
jgi:hypothetical protein